MRTRGWIVSLVLGLVVKKSNPMAKTKLQPKNILPESQPLWKKVWNILSWTLLIIFFIFAFIAFLLSLSSNHNETKKESATTSPVIENIPPPEVQEKSLLIEICQTENLSYADMLRNAKTEFRFTIKPDVAHNTISLQFKHYTYFLHRNEIVPKCLIENLENADKYQQIIPRVLGFTPNITNVVVIPLSQKNLNK